MSVRFTLTADVPDIDADRVEAELRDVARRADARLTRAEYEDHPSYRLLIRRRTLRKILGEVSGA